MALKYADRVAESAVNFGAGGLGDIQLAGPIDGEHDTFAKQFADGDQMPVAVFGNGRWMTFEGQYNAGANSISVVKVRRSSTGSQVALSGTMTVLCGWTADDAFAVAPGYVLEGGSIVVSATAGALTASVRTLSGAVPTPANPVYVRFRDATLPSGGYVRRAITAACSIVLPSGASLGFVNGKAARAWFSLHDVAGTVVMGAFNASAASGVWCPAEANKYTTAVPGNSPQTLYTSAAITTAAPVVLIGFAEWSVFTSAGTWTAPTLVSMMSAGSKKPGDIVQSVNAESTSQYGVTSGNAGQYYNSSLTGVISPTSAANVVKINWITTCYAAGGSMGFSGRLFSNAAGAAVGPIAVVANGPVNSIYNLCGRAQDRPSTINAVSYTLQIAPDVTGFGYAVGYSGSIQSMDVVELMG